MSEHDPLINPSSDDDSSQDRAIDRSLRPLTLDEFIGQPKVREQLGIFIACLLYTSDAADE